MDTLSDMTVTLPETLTVTPAQIKPIGSTKGEKKYQNPNVTPTPTKDRQTPVTDTSSIASKTSKLLQFFSPSGQYIYKPSPMTQPSTVESTEKSPIPIMEDEPWDVEGTERVTNTAVKDIKLPLTQKLDDFATTYSTDDDDIDSLAEPRVSLSTKILPYPGYKDFGPWLESQCLTTIPSGTEAFLQQLTYSQKKT